MKLRDVLHTIKNKANNQSVWNPKKKKLRELDLTEEDILNIKLERLLK